MFLFFVCAAGCFINSIKEKCLIRVTKRVESHSNRVTLYQLYLQTYPTVWTWIHNKVGLTKSLVSESDGLDSDGDFSFSLCSP
jgi:hypothetical protein